MQVFFERREELAPGIWQYYFRPEGRLDFVPGQYTWWQLPDVTNDPRGSFRTFSLTSLPTDPSLCFVVKDRVPVSPYKKRLATIEEGYAARIDNAIGDLVLPKDPSVPL